MQALVQDALNSFQSVPNPYAQVIINPVRITSDGGNLKFAVVGWNKVALPDTTSAWHIYQVGQLPPAYFNLLQSTNYNVWQKVSDTCVAKKLIIDLYGQNGVMLPRTTAYYSWLDDKNLVFAVQINKKIAKFSYDADRLFVRIYQNPYFQGASVPPTANVQISGSTIATTADILTYQNAIAAITSGVGYTGGLYCFVNGVKVPGISVLTAKAGDYVEYVYDGSIYQVVDLALSSLQTFVSTLDNKVKYLIHYTSGWSGYIDHCSDVDVFLTHTTLNIGTYVHKNAADAMRMVTYRDYSIPATYITDYLGAFADPTTGQIDATKINVRLHIRRSGLNHLPKDDSNKIQYLLQMSPSAQLSAMVGVNAVNPYWQAASLESSGINALLNAQRKVLTLAGVQNAYGYAGCNYALAKNVVASVAQASGNPLVALPIAYQSGATAYEYNSVGVLLGYYAVLTGVTSYACNNVGCTTVELVSGSAGQVLDEFYGSSTLSLTPGYNYRYYTRPTVSGVTAAKYADVTGQSAQYSVSGANLITWTTPSSVVSFVRSDKKHLAYQVTLAPTDGVLIHAVNYTINSVNNSTALVPFAEYDFWLNGHPLVEGVDYFFNFPTVQIVSKAYLNASGTNTLTVRCFGLCGADLVGHKHTEVGFVYGGMLSANASYDLHLARNMRVVCGGSLLPETQQKFVESSTSGGLVNGAPYEIRELVNAMNGLLSSDPYALWSTDNVAEAAAKAYLTRYAPEVKPAISAITQKYALYSPFICKIIYALKSGNISASAISGLYPDSTVSTLVTPYLYLLAGDPIKSGNTPDTNYVTIHAHWLNTPITLSADQYRFVTNAIRMYANGLVSVSTLLQIA